MDPKARFNVLRAELGISLEQLARDLGMSYGTLKAYAAPSRPDMIPPPDVLDAMQRTLLQLSIDRVRAAGLEVIPRRRAA